VWEKIGWASEGYSAAMAAHLRAERIRSLRHGEELPQKKKIEVTFGEVWKKYEQWMETNKRSQTDRYLYQKHLGPRFAEKVLSQISPFELEQMKMELQKKGLSPASVKHNLVLVRQIINKAITWGMWVGENPVKKVNIPRLNNRRERFLSVEESRTILDELHWTSKQLHNMALLSLHTGMRAGEIFALKFGHLDLENCIISIANPKGGEAQEAYMTPSVREMFQKLGTGEPEGLVFRSRKDGRIREVSDTFSRVIDRLGLNQGITDARQKVTFHTLRHTFASWLALDGTPILTIKELMRHQTLAMTERYSHLIPETKRQAVAGIERLFRKKASSPPRRKKTA
jgi:integrase